jgi:hypothetical protein
VSLNTRVVAGERDTLGTHEELLRESALYRDLVGHRQMGAVPVA